MASTMCRAWDLNPDDIVIRDSAHPDGEVVVYFGETVSVQGPPDQLHALLRIAVERVHAHSLRLPEREPF